MPACILDCYVAVVRGFGLGLRTNCATHTVCEACTPLLHRIDQHQANSTFSSEQGVPWQALYQLPSRFPIVGAISLYQSPTGSAIAGTVLAAGGRLCFDIPQDPVHIYYITILEHCSCMRCGWRWVNAFVPCVHAGMTLCFFLGGIQDLMAYVSLHWLHVEVAPLFDQPWMVGLTAPAL
jgi:hypothetical protein